MRSRPASPTLLAQVLFDGRRVFRRRQLLGWLGCMGRERTLSSEQCSQRARSRQVAAMRTCSPVVFCRMNMFYFHLKARAPSRVLYFPQWVSGSKSEPGWSNSPTSCNPKRHHPQCGPLSLGWSSSPTRRAATTLKGAITSNAAESGMVKFTKS